jgi:hypothetical protein
MGELAKASLRFSWAVSLFGVKQLMNALKPSDPNRPAHAATAAFDSVTAATEGQLEGFIRRTFKAGDSLQRGTVDLMFGGLTLQTFTPRGMMKMTFDLMQQSAEAFKFLMPGQNSRVVWQEFKNKLQAFDLFEYVDAALHLSAGTDLPLTESVGRAAALGSYRSVWATEGLGHYYAETCWDQRGTPRQLLSAEIVSGLPARCLIPLHAGMGLSFANRILETITPQSSLPEIREALRRFVALCKDNAGVSYVGAVYESLGLAARNLHPQMVPIIDRQLSEINDTLVGYFWHGVGRAIYFAPTNFLPGGSAPWRGVEMTQREPAHETGRLNALAGLAWALTLVNIRHPGILETLLKYHGHELSASDAFRNGVTSALITWHDSTEGDPYITALRQHQPDPADPVLVGLWNSLLKRPCEDALQRYYPVLKKHRCLGELFRYQSLTGLVEQLERQTRAGAESPSVVENWPRS